MSYFLAFAGFAALIILHEFGHFAAAKAVGMRVERFALFFPPMLWKVKRGETEYGVGAIPLGGYVRISGMNPNEELPPEVQPRAYYNQAVWKRVVVILAGPVMNLLIAFAIFLGLYALQGQQTLSPVVDTIEAGSPAFGHLQPGDRILAVDGKGSGPEDFATLVGRHRCGDNLKVAGCNAATRASLTIERDGVKKTVRVRPAYDPAVGRSRIGFSFQTPVVKQGVVDASGSAVSAMWRVTKESVTSLTRLVYDSKARKQVSGVVGSYETTREVIQKFGFADAMNILAVISLSLAIVNLFPFLPLDGGHIFWAVAEKVRGRRIPFSVMERASVVGFMLVIALFLVGFTNDIGRIRGSGFGVH